MSPAKYSVCFEIKHDLLLSFTLIMTQYKIISFFFKENRSCRHAFDQIRCKNQYATGFALLFGCRIFTNQVAMFFWGKFVLVSYIKKTHAHLSLFQLCSYGIGCSKKMFALVKYIFSLFWNKIWFVVVIQFDSESISNNKLLKNKLDLIRTLSIKLNAKINTRQVSHQFFGCRFFSNQVALISCRKVVFLYCTNIT